MFSTNLNCRKHSIRIEATSFDHTWDAELRGRCKREETNQRYPLSRCKQEYYLPQVAALHYHRKSRWAAIRHTGTPIHTTDCKVSANISSVVRQTVRYEIDHIGRYGLRARIYGQWYKILFCNESWFGLRYNKRNLRVCGWYNIRLVVPALLQDWNTVRKFVHTAYQQLWYGQVLWRTH